MSEINTWVVVDQHDQYVSEECPTFAEARNDAEQRAQQSGEPHAVVMFTYVFDDSELSWTSNGADVWPPSAPPEEQETIT